MVKGNSGWDKAALVLAGVGALNWGLAELGWNAVTGLLGSWPILVSIVYYVVAVAGIWTLVKAFK
jgi:uncharacterized membrane protein YuzA (DUF378 family)